MAYSELTISDLLEPSSFRKGMKIIPSSETVGQEIALKALKFGLELSAPKSHFFCVGPKGVGRTTLTLQVLKDFAHKNTLKKDWVYVANFNCLSSASALPLPVGQGYAFAQQMTDAVLLLRQEIKKLFQQKNYQVKIQELESFFHHKKESFLKEIKGHFLSKGIALVQSGAGYGLCPIIEDKVLNADEFNCLSVQVRQKLLSQLEKAKSELSKFLEKLLVLDDEKDQMVQKVNQVFLSHQLSKTFEVIQTNFKKQNEVVKYLSDASSFVLQNGAFLGQESESEKIWSYLQVNPFLCHETSTLPVICPGQIDLPILLGNFVDETKKNQPLYMQLSAGILYQANGGFLVLNAKELLDKKEVFDVLKQVLFMHKVPFKNTFLSEIPLDIKVVLIGSRSVYEELKAQQEDFSELFKIVVPFEEQMARTATSEKLYVGQLAHFVKENHLKAVSISAYNALLNYASRLALTPKRALTLHMGKVHDILRSADYLARQTHAHQIEALHVQKALFEQKERESLSQKQWLDHITSGMLMLDVKGIQVGSVNTLCVCATDDKRFGRVSRLACTICAGTGQITDIEGKITLGGPLHAKGILILQNYLKAHFGQREALKLDASLGFEQSYGPIDGDSASCAELCALMSAIGYIPLKQSVALTGAVNVYGQVGAVAGINEKIEGFFEACQALGDQENQGVIFPKACLKELLLKSEVIQAVKLKKFHLYAVETIEECMEILSGLNKKAIDEKISTAWHHAFLNAKK